MNGWRGRRCRALLREMEREREEVVRRMSAQRKEIERWKTEAAWWKDRCHLLEEQIDALGRER